MDLGLWYGCCGCVGFCCFTGFSGWLCLFAGIVYVGFGFVVVWLSWILAFDCAQVVVFWCV